MKGRKPKPTAVKKLTGNPGKRALNKLEPMPLRVIPNCPPGMSKLQRAYWDYYAGVLDRANILTEADMTVLAVFCKDIAEADIFEKILDKEGWVQENSIVDSAGRERIEKKAHPLAMRLEKRRDSIRHYSNLLGLNPSARAGLKIEKGAEEDEFERFMKGKSGKK